MREPALFSLFVSHWQISPVLSAEAALAACAYLIGVVRLRGRWPLERTVSFLAGILAGVVALESGIDAYDDRLLSVHMVQHMILLLVVPLLLIGGRPVILLLRALSPSGRRRLVHALPRLRALTGPWQGLGLYFVVLGVSHTAWFYDATLSHPLLHQVEHALFVLSGVLLLWPLLDGDPVPAHRLGPLGKLFYMLAAMVPMAIIGAYLNRHTTVVYAPYGPAARALGVSAVDDQATAGAIMWVVGNTLMMLIGICTVILALRADERRQRMRDARAAAALGDGVAGEWWG